MNRMPEVIRWDASKKHHFALFMDETHHVVRASCFDCDVAIDRPLSEVATVESELRGGESVQVILRVVINE